MGGINDNEIDDFVNFAKEEPVDVRFIEYMPLVDPEQSIEFISNDIILSKIKFPMKPIMSEPGSTAKTFKIPGFKGRIGFISPISHKFCSNCSRIRLTADGMLRSCLINNKVVDLKTPLRNGSEDDFIEQLLKNAVFEKMLDSFVIFMKNVQNKQLAHVIFFVTHTRIIVHSFE